MKAFRWVLVRQVSFDGRPLFRSCRSDFRLDSDAIIDRRRDPLGAAEVTFCGLDGDVTKQELNLLQLASGGSTKPGAASAQIARRELAYAVAPGGMALWVCLRTSVNVDAWARRSIQHGVSWYTGRRYAFDGKSKPFGRLSFAWLNERELTEAVQRMAAAPL